jgi:hypothetical protein
MNMPTTSNDHLFIQQEQQKTIKKDLGLFIFTYFKFEIIKTVTISVDSLSEQNEYLVSFFLHLRNLT